MNKSDKIRLFVKNNPKCSVNEISIGTGIEKSLISQVVFRDTGNGYLSRYGEEYHYRYSVNEGAFSHLDQQVTPITKDIVQQVTEQIMSKISIDDIVKNIALELAVKVLDYVKSEFKELPKSQGVLTKPINNTDDNDNDNVKSGDKNKGK